MTMVFKLIEMVLIEGKICYMGTLKDILTTTRQEIWSALQTIRAERQKSNTT